MARRALVNPPGGRLRDGNLTRTRDQRQGDLVEIAAMFMRGLTHNQMVDEINSKRQYKLTIKQVEKDVAYIISEWRSAYLGDINDRKATELARIDKLEAAAWEEWERSKNDSTSESVAQTEKEGHDEKLGDYSFVAKTARKTKTPGRGRVDCLQTIQWCINQRCRILGIAIPNAVFNFNWRNEVVKEGIDPEELLDVVTDAFVKKLTDPSAKSATASSRLLGAGGLVEDAEFTEVE